MTTFDMEKGFQEIWQLFKETAEMFKETEKRFKETDVMFKETDKKFKETDERFKVTDRELERLERFKVFFPEHKERKAVGAVGGTVMEGDSGKFAYRNGFFVIGESGENAMILNDKKFKPRVW